MNIPRMRIKNITSKRTKSRIEYRLDTSCKPTSSSPWPRGLRGVENELQTIHSARDNDLFLLINLVDEHAVLRGEGRQDFIIDFIRIGVIAIIPIEMKFIKQIKHLLP